ncbi:hypothetical protein C8Q76DRAFT_318460 [Earliella scabrosa]|nr:hypothetical protein C8Q76DRAFT_318460 [Earliella scabrosa]
MGEDAKRRARGRSGRHSDESERRRMTRKNAEGRKMGGGGHISCLGPLYRRWSRFIGAEAMVSIGVSAARRNATDMATARRQRVNIA